MYIKSLGCSRQSTNVCPSVLPKVWKNQVWVRLHHLTWVEEETAAISCHPHCRQGQLPAVVGLLVPPEP